jgi:hypothetical protein
MRAGRNVWKCHDELGCGFEFKSKSRPDECPACGGSYINPKLNLRRLHGWAYEFYRGSSDWENAANEVLKRKANQNFRSSH